MLIPTTIHRQIAPKSPSTPGQYPIPTIKPNFPTKNRKRYTQTVQQKIK
uniref:Uncharacterized protein n=1 Tax=Rhizophora mucronata TaxID=61149 RepID=A0A2P2JVQ8_RHIMU